MMNIFLVAEPVAAALIMLLLKGRSIAVRTILLFAAILHVCGTLCIFCFPESPITQDILPEWIGTDNLSIIFLAIISFLFLCSSAHGWFWLPAAGKYENHGGEGIPEHIFCAATAVFVAAMTLAVCARNLGLLWVAVEATTLASAPLIMFHRSKSALEAMWKYLLICSVGIALALLGTFMLEVAVRNPDGSAPGLNIALLQSPELVINTEWFKAAFIFCFAGYGLKMGLAPFHFWLPDAHSEAPSMVSVMLSGALLNCSFLGIIRVISIAPESLHGFCNELLIAFGVMSLLTAAIFMIRQGDFKRMLAYSSCEHMGLLAVFWGLNEYETGLLHMGLHSLCKMLLFLTAGNILLACGSRSIKKVSGIFGSLPVNALVWCVGILMICGMPPSPLFITEYRLVMAAGGVLGGIILFLLFIVFAAMTAAALRMTAGGSGKESIRPEAGKTAEELAFLPCCLLAGVVCVGILLTVREAGLI